jgi:hypothetical protein
MAGAVVLNIILGTGHPREEEARLQLLRLLEEYDLDRWQFTAAVRIENGVAPHSHPVLTLNTRHLDDDDRALATYIHEQLHWYVFTRDEGMRTALEELMQRFPRVPTADEGGARDEFSTYLHLIVGALEYASLMTLLGADGARRTIERMDVYPWVYARLLDDWNYFRDLLARHDLALNKSNGPG